MLKRLGGWISNVDNIFASISLILIISVTVIGVFMRYVLGDPLKWTEEMTMALFVWFTFLGASVVTKEDGHVGIEYFVEKLNPVMRKIAFLFRQMVLISLNVYVFFYLGIQLTALATDKLTPILRISYIYIDVAVVLSGVFSTIHILSHMFNMSDKNKAESTLIEKDNEKQYAPQKEAKA
ncbi:TRAP transporter small permease [Bacillus sp. FJAT-29790]|uniref:TRAP transporter small permease n=1 Tax=Bacillus sp. FJAT-29790 TaxID=1895002 RepID=UPI001C21EACB|nr:TRAP transporter small permease [Bacillus sp. FJAT-29790]MBU8877578.1 TRAP transporter small permease [Bacillus sp. FJAT-29790]